MKAKTYTYGIITTIALIITINASASSFTFNEEEYIDDIPFNTELVVESLTTSNTLELVQFDEESYIDDIPFNTGNVAESYLSDNDSLPAFEEEAYINDIPFNTEEVVIELNYHEALYAEFDMSEESYIDDIPFDTFAISKEYNKEIAPVFYSVVVTSLEF